MIKTTREQRETLKRKWVEQNRGLSRNNRALWTYREFRRSVQPGWGCIMVYWCHMWLGIEPDGYAHT